VPLRSGFFSWTFASLLAVAPRRLPPTRANTSGSECPVRLLMDLIRAFNPCLRILSHRPSREAPSLTHPLVEHHPDEQRIVVLGEQLIGCGIAGGPKRDVGHVGHSARARRSDGAAELLIHHIFGPRPQGKHLLRGHQPTPVGSVLGEEQLEAGVHELRSGLVDHAVGVDLGAWRSQSID
jgi:hypothetical protein